MPSLHQKLIKNDAREARRGTCAKQATKEWSLLDQGDGDSARSHHFLDLFAEAAQKLMWQDKYQNIGIACCAHDIGVGYDICRQFNPRHVLDVFVLLSVKEFVTKNSWVCGNQVLFDACRVEDDFSQAPYGWNLQGRFFSLQLRAKGA
jgi:hypothetical protein